MSKSTVKLEDYIQLLRPSSFIKSYQLKLLLISNAKWVRELLKKLPLSLRESVLQELKHMEADGVIEQIDAPPSNSNLVIAQIKVSGVRLICIRKKHSNKNIIHEVYHVRRVVVTNN